MRMFIIRGYAAGMLVLETTHTSEASAAIEVECWRDRMRRGEVMRCELIDCRPGGTLTNLYIYEHTVVPWPWLRDNSERAST